MKVLILGGTGLLGNALLKTLSKKFETIGTTRINQVRSKLNYVLIKDVQDKKNLTDLIMDANPDVVINCISLRNFNSSSFKELESVYVLFPKILSILSIKFDFKVIHISTDAVFSGKKGNYNENDTPDPIDDYGKTKFLGEPDQENCVVIRTSMIGHSNNGETGLLDWFLKQKDCTLYKNAIFSGLPVNELSKIISDHFIVNSDLEGIFHISSKPISKYDLLSKVRDLYDLKVSITADETYKIDRSLDSSKFRNLTGYRIKSWNDMITKMREENY